MDAEAKARARSKVFVIVGVVGVAAVALYFALGMPGMDHGNSMSSSMSSMDHAASSVAPAAGAKKGGAESVVKLLDPASFADRMKEGAAVVVNVHVPFEGDLDGTDLSIPFDKIAEQVSVLPAGRDMPLLVYCRSGRMSKIATVELIRLGYRDVADLDGGMLAWEKSGRKLISTVASGSVA